MKNLHWPESEDGELDGDLFGEILDGEGELADDREADDREGETGLDGEWDASSLEAEAPGASAAGTYFKDVPGLRRATLAAVQPITLPAGSPALRRRMAATYNRLGGLMSTVARQVRVDTPAVLSVWHVESGGRTHVPGRLLIRFENHVFFRYWGSAHPAQYDLYFRHGGRRGVPGRAFRGHQFRTSPSQPFRELHPGRRPDESAAAAATRISELQYQALRLASSLGGEEAALKSISMGGPQVMGSNHRLLGYASVAEMYRAFQADERWHVLGFFDFCRHRSSRVFDYLRRHDWANFALVYNGKGQVAAYSAHLRAAYSQASRLPIPGAAATPAHEIDWEGLVDEPREAVEPEWDDDRELTVAGMDCRRFGFQPVPVERPGGRRIQNLREPAPAELTTVSGATGRPISLHRVAARALSALVANARRSGIAAPLLLPTSGYRSVARQQQLWQEAIRTYGSPDIARRWVARPGHSPHQTGRAVDLYLGGRNSSGNVARLRVLPAYRWLAENAVCFGFHPYASEPWHWEYNPAAA